MENNNHYEELIDQMMIDEVSGLDTSIKATLEGLTDRQKRMAILSILDKDRDLYVKLRKIVDNNTVSKSQHIKTVVKMLRRYVEVGDVEKKKFGEVMTPISLVEDMLDKLPKEVWSNPELKWLDNCNGVGVFPCVVVERLMDGLSNWEKDEEKRYRHIMENMIYVAELQPKNMFLYLCGFDPYDEYVLNIYTGSFLDESFDNHMRDVWGVDKFDIIVGNPPYNGGIDLKFLTKSYQISNQLLYVHPSTWVIDEKSSMKRFTLIKELINGHFKYIKLFNGNGIFGISLFVPCVITYIDKQTLTNTIELEDEINDIYTKILDINDINKYNTDEYISIKDKIITISHNCNVWGNMRFNTNKPRNSKKISISKRDSYVSNNPDYVINLGRIRGHVNIGQGTNMLKNDFYTIIEKGLIVEKDVNKHMFLNFPTELEANNCLKYFKTKIFMFCLSIFKNKSDIDCGELTLVPWLDFSQEWTDEKLIKEFNLTEEEVAFIEKVIPTYY
jgi:site-specific DNA-methyltransferase (adenine-specific)